MSTNNLHSFPDDGAYAGFRRAVEAQREANERAQQLEDLTWLWQLAVTGTWLVGTPAGQDDLPSYLDALEQPAGAQDGVTAQRLKLAAAEGTAHGRGRSRRALPEVAVLHVPAWSTRGDPKTRVFLQRYRKNVYVRFQGPQPPDVVRLEVRLHGGARVESFEPSHPLVVPDRDFFALEVLRGGREDNRLFQVVAPPAQGPAWAQHRAYDPLSVFDGEEKELLLYARYPDSGKELGPRPCVLPPLGKGRPRVEVDMSTGGLPEVPKRLVSAVHAYHRQDRAAFHDSLTHLWGYGRRGPGSDLPSLRGTGESQLNRTYLLTIRALCAELSRGRPNEDWGVEEAMEHLLFA